MSNIVVKIVLDRLEFKNRRNIFLTKSLRKDFVVIIFHKKKQVKAMPGLTRRRNNAAKTAACIHGCIAKSTDTLRLCPGSTLNGCTR